MNIVEAQAKMAPGIGRTEFWKNRVGIEQADDPLRRSACDQTRHLRERRYKDHHRTMFFAERLNPAAAGDPARETREFLPQRPSSVAVLLRRVDDARVRWCA